MSSNIYEDPNLTMTVKYSKGGCEDGGQRVERLVDIYHSLDRDSHRYTPQRGTHSEKHLPAVQRNSFKITALVLGLLCLLLLVGLTVVSIRYISSIRENKQLSISNEKLQTLQRRCGCQSLKTHGNITEWERFKSSCYYKSTEMKNWTESRRDCQNRGADLVIINSKGENDFISKWNKPEASWIGLQPQLDGWVWTWKWVDGSSLKYKAWKTYVKIEPEYRNMSTAYIDLEGNWNQTNNGSKRWICEKQLYPV